MVYLINAIGITGYWSTAKIPPPTMSQIIMDGLLGNIKQKVIESIWDETWVASKLGKGEVLRQYRQSRIHKRKKANEFEYEKLKCKNQLEEVFAIFSTHKWMSLKY